MRRSAVSDDVLIATLFRPILKPILERLVNRENMKMVNIDAGIHPDLRQRFGLKPPDKFSIHIGYQMQRFSIDLIVEPRTFHFQKLIAVDQ